MIAQEDFEALFAKNTKAWGVYSVLSDREWHCRSCEYEHIGTTQIAGSGGIQGLERGTKKRPGMEIVSGNHLCRKCERSTYQDRWTGNFVTAVVPRNMPTPFALQVVEVLGSRDVVDNTQRPPNQLTVDHKLPMIRWDDESAKRQTAYGAMSEADIKAMFQLLKKSNGSVSHNMLKSRACEQCFKTGRRGTPFGVAFFYDGNGRWRPKSKTDASGCIGCGWYDFAAWRSALNAQLKRR